MVICWQRIMLFIVLIFISSFLFAQKQVFRFHNKGMEQGLSDNRVTTICKDQQGFMWFGTASGLNRYDGNSFKTFKRNPADTSSISDNYIDQIVTGPQQTLWIYTPNGWSKYDPATEKFVSKPLSFLKQLGLPHEWFTTITKDKQGDFWFTYLDSGLYQYNAVTGYVTRFNSSISVDPLLPYPIASIAFDNSRHLWIAYTNGVLEKRDVFSGKLRLRSIQLSRLAGESNMPYKLFIDSDNHIWVFASGKGKGVWWVQPEREQSTLLNTSSVVFRLKSDIVNGIVEDASKNIWIATDHGGVNIINKKKGTIDYLLEDKLMDNAINTIFNDGEGVIWLGTVRKGVSYQTQNTILFTHYNSTTAGNTFFPYDDVNCFAEDSSGNLWVGTNGEGLIYLDRRTNVYKRYRATPGKTNVLSSDIITSLFVDKKGIVWIGTYYGGLNSFDGRQFVQYKNNAKDNFSLPDDKVWKVFEDSRGRLWIGTLSQGLVLFDREKNKFIPYRYINPFAGAVNAIMEDRQGRIWAGGTGGIDILDKEGRFVRRIFQNGNDKNTISNNVVFDIVEDQAGDVWVATRDGLNYYNAKLDSFQVYGTRDGLPHNTIFRILQDEKEQLWLSTPNGLSRASINYSAAGLPQIRFNNYNVQDGLQGNLFNQSSALITRKKELVFGGPNGWNMFFPIRATEEKLQARLLFTSLQVFNTTVRVGESYKGRVILSESISVTNKIKLSYNQNAFAFEFAALDFKQADKLEYAYQLKGFSNTWILADKNSRKAAFAGLRPGLYTLSVNARYGNGEWSDHPAEITIYILPPFWQTSWAYSLYALLFIAGLVYGRYYIVQREKRKFLLQQERAAYQRNQELNLMKIHLFTNISHEFRTPLALITSPIEDLLKKEEDANKRRLYKLIQRNAHRLLNMVNELLDFRKLEMKELHLNNQSKDIIAFIRELVESFSDISERKRIALHFNTRVDEMDMMFDPDKMERILFNLLSNAFKFTQEGGTITVSLTKEGVAAMERMEIKVSDTGIGINKEKLEKIFDRYFQEGFTQLGGSQGNGIGLAITKEFVRLHGGTIRAESELRKGSSFTVSLPVVVKENPKPAREDMQKEGNNTEHKEGLVKENFSFHGGRKKILIVEDDDDYRFYIKENLKEYYNILEATDGKMGWQKIVAEHPDLIVTDLNMPELSGIELCRKVKEDNRTAFIPCLLLTMYTGEEHQLQGLETGANDYITKPFNFEMLLFKIRNLLIQQDNFKKTYQRQVTVSATEPSSQLAVEDDLVKKALAFVEKNMANPQLSVNEMSKALLLSRATLYKKIFHLTGQSPMDFIRSVRLQRARQLLKMGELSISEVAYEVGFNDPKYFTKVFKETYQITPSAYQEEQKK